MTPRMHSDPLSYSSVPRAGRAFSGGLYAEKTGKAYDAYVVLEDDGTRSTYRIELEKKG